MHTIAIPFLLVSFAPMSGAQDPPPPAQPSIERLVPVHTAPDDPEGERYGIWGAGPGYKVSFHDGLQFLPMVGSAARGAAAVRWRTRSVRVGGVELANGERETLPRWTSMRCEYDHGGVVEAYDLRADGVEQTFVLRERPATGGDLVVAGEIEGLRPAGQGAGGELLLCGEDGDVLATYGAATAIAADGSTCAMQRACDGSRVTLTLDAAWLDGAAWPITVDPLLRPNVSLGFSRRVVDVDVFRDDLETDHEVWVATTIEDAGTGDRDLVVQRVNDDFTDARDVFLDVTTAWHAGSARLCGVGGTDKVVAAFVRVLSTGSAVRWHLHAKADLAVSTSVAGVTRPGGTHDARPDVGGSDSFAPGRFALLAWQRDVAPTPANTNQSRVLVAVLDTAAAGQGTLGAQVSIEPSGTGDGESPSVNQEAEGGNAFSWVVAWARTNGVQPRLIGVRRVDRLGQPTASRLDVPAGFPLFGQGPPQIAGRDGRYLCAYGMRGNGGTFHEVVATRVDWPHGAPAGSLPHGSTSIEASNALDAVVHGLAFDTLSRCHWVLTRRDVAFDQLRALKLGFRGRIVEVEDLPITGGRLPLHSGVAFDDDAGRFVVAAALQPTLPTQSGSVQLDAMRYDAVLPVVFYGTGCTPARVAWSGSQHVGDEFTRLSLLQGQPSSAVFLTLATTPANVDLAFAGMPGCFLLANPGGPGGVGTVSGFSDAGGRFDLPLPLPETLGPIGLRVQAFQLAPGANAAGIVATRGVRVELGR